LSKKYTHLEFFALFLYNAIIKPERTDIMDNRILRINFETSPDTIFIKHIKKQYPTVQPPIEHSHNRYEMFVILHGVCTFFVQNTLLHMEAGDLCIVPPYCIHSMSYPNTYHEHIVINFSEQYVDKKIEDELNEVISWGKYTPTPEDATYIKDILEDIFANAESTDMYNLVYLKTCFDRLFVKMLRTKEQFNKDIKTDTLSRDISRVLEYISHNYYQDITLVEMAESCHVSPSYFSKFFKKTIGMGFKEYVTFTRLTVAENLLKTTDLSIADIAYETGFNDSNYFSLVFRQHYGTPPTDYRKKRRKKTTL
jgi:AraC-like DNA-binding protein/mannose-6-phosphate isomerase-like protein (cupin superfamily)